MSVTCDECGTIIGTIRSMDDNAEYEPEAKSYCRKCSGKDVKSRIVPRISRYTVYVDEIKTRYLGSFEEALTKLDEEQGKVLIEKIIRLVTPKKKVRK